MASRSSSVALVRRPGWPALLARRPGRKTLAVFTRQLATLLQAGLPLLRGLELLRRQEKNPAMDAVLVALAAAVRNGGNLSDGLRQHPALFDRLYVSMVRAGEAAGAMAVVLARLARFMEKAERIRGRVRAALTYPIIVTAVATAIVGLLMTFVVPRFQGIFSGVLKGQPLPALTQGVLAACNTLRSHAPVLAGAAIAAALLLGAARRSAAGCGFLDGALLHTPFFGDLARKAAVARFARTLATLLDSGVPMLQALVITRDTAGNTRISAAIALVHDRVKAGEPMARPLAAARVFPGMVAGMVEVGEETGALAEMLACVADAYDDEVDNAVAALTSVIEPVMIVAMAVVVGVIVVALFLPIVRIIQLMS